jgi:hypothetical protein
VVRWRFVNRRGSVVCRGSKLFGAGRGGVDFRTGFRKQPARQATGGTTRNVDVRRLLRTGLLGAGEPGRRFVAFGLPLLGLRFGHWNDWSRGRFAAIFRERLAGEKNRFFDSAVGSGGSVVTSAFGTPIVEAALLRATRFETARLRAALIA